MQTTAAEIETLADALASCVQSTSHCSKVTSNLPSYASGSGMFVYMLINNYSNTNMQTVLNNLLSAMSSLNVPWASPTTTSSSTTITATTNTYTVGSGPEGIAINSVGYIYIADNGINTITELNQSGTIMGTYNIGSKSSNSMPIPQSVAIDSTGNIWITSSILNTIDYYTNNGSVTELSPSGTIIGTFSLSFVPDAIAIDSAGNIWVTGTSGDIDELSPSGTIVGTYYAGGGGTDGIAISSSGNIWVANFGGLGFNNGSVTELSPSGTIIGTYNISGNISSIAIDSAGNVWAANWMDANVTELSSAGKTMGTYSAGFDPQDIAIDSAGNIWVLGSDNITELSPSGTTITTYPVGGEIMAINNSGDIFVTNYISNSITELLNVAKGPEYFPYSGPQWPSSNSSGYNYY